VTARGPASARLTLVRGDLTTQRVDAIVNAANATLRPGGGVCGAIHRAAGPALAEECARSAPCATGSAVATGAGLLPARFVIHAVGPVWRGGGEGEAALLASAFRSAAAEAVRVGARTVAFPALSCGIFGYPLQAAARVAVAALQEVLAAHPSLVETRLVLFDAATEAVFRAALAES